MVYVFMADGTEEIEALTPVDLLRRAKLEVRTVSVNGKVVTGSHGIPMICDLMANELRQEECELVILPGGMPGTNKLEASSAVQSLLDYAANHDRWIAAICAAPSILGKKGLLEGKTATCYPGYEDTLTGAVLGSDAVCVDGRYITARGAGVAMDFSLKLVELLCGDPAAEQLREAMQCRP